MAVSPAARTCRVREGPTRTRELLDSLLEILTRPRVLHLREGVGYARAP
jgi:hypothetical protein